MKKSNLLIILSIIVIVAIFTSNFAFAANALDAADGSPTNAVYVDNDGNVGIGTTNLDGTPAIGKVTIKGSTSDGSTNIIVGRDSSETNVFSIDTNGRIIGSSISASESITDDTSETQIRFDMKPTTTSNNDSTHAGLYNSLRPIINTGVTQSGYEMGQRNYTFRNYNGESADDSGTLTSLFGQGLYYGHYNTNTSADPQTTTVFGLYMRPYYITGDITNLYDIYIDSGFSGGIVSNQYAIYQESSSAKNYFAGNVGIGTTTPATTLDVAGIIQTTGGFTSSLSNDNIFKTSNNYFSVPYVSGYASLSWFNYYDGSNYIASHATVKPSRMYVNTNGYSFQTSQTTGVGSIISDWSTKFFIGNTGNVGIGTTSPNYKLDVLGTIRATEIKVETGWSDFVFDDNYNLPSLTQVESYIEKNKHLPDIPSAEEVKENGLSLAEIVTKQMQKIEEITLYLIEMKKGNEELKAQISELKGSLLN